MNKKILLQIPFVLFIVSKTRWPFYWQMSDTSDWLGFSNILTDQLNFKKTTNSLKILYLDSYH